jgi:hypothetical protein
MQLVCSRTTAAPVAGCCRRRWTILARSESFTSYDDAERAAPSARFDRRAGEFTPVDLGARRDGPSDDLDAERWLDEGGSFSSEAVLT